MLLAPLAQAAEPVVPAQPADPAGAKAYRVLETSCAGCHQVGRLRATLTRPAADLANILDLETLARNPALVVPGSADASPLYTAIQGRTMPPEGGGEQPADDIALSPADLLAVRDWIEQLPPATAACADRVPVTPAMLARAVGAAATKLDAARAATTRFISLAPLHNGCATPAEMQAAIDAVAMLINSLSLALEPVRPTATGADGLLLAVDLAAIGWDHERWDRLAFRAPAVAFVTLDEATQKSLGTRAPVVDADWFADAATRAPIYYDVLGLPDTLGGLLANARIDLSEATPGTVHRIGLRTSVVARGNRLIERRPFAGGTAWIARDFAPTAGRPDLFDMTVAAAGGDATKPRALPQPDATLLHFSLPNGFPAYFAANASGQRINDVPASVLRSGRHPSMLVQAAQSCIGCHAGGPVARVRGRTDDLKARLLVEAGLAKDVRDRLLAAHPEPAEWLKRIDEDQARLRRALAAAGLGDVGTIGGLAPLPALIARYQRPVAIDEIANMAGQEPARLLAAGRSGSLALADVAARLAFGRVARAEVDFVLPELAARAGFAVPGGGAVSAAAPPLAAVPDLILKAERPVYQNGDLLVLSVRANFTCALTVLTLDGKGRATVLYPNEFEGSVALEPNREIRIPGDKAPYQLRLRDKGSETLIGICAAGGKAVDGIHHDFEKQRFTELGDYRAFLSRAWGTDGKPRRPARKPGETVEPAQPAEPQARTAIRIRIE